MNRESPIGITASWVALIASFVLSFASWLSLGDLSGYGWVKLALPFCADAYIVSALVTWMRSHSERVKRFARINTYAAATIGIFTQSVYHGATVWGATHVGWKAAIATAVGAFPPACAALSVHLRGLVWNAAATTVSEDAETPSAMSPATPPVASASSPAEFDDHQLAPASPVEPPAGVASSPAELATFASVHQPASSPAPAHQLASPALTSHQPDASASPHQSPAPALTSHQPPASAGDASDTSPQVKARQLAKVRDLVRQGKGRQAIASQLAISPHQARQLIASVAGENRQSPARQLRAVGGVAR